ncbi:MAG: hypothetical protein EHM70_15290 [Chloroflexota bacterium]|nr:MAG: hypothetical protein EHM70_15290 [Chloroflexota bacterium]
MRRLILIASVLFCLMLACNTPGGAPALTGGSSPVATGVDGSTGTGSTGVSVDCPDLPPIPTLPPTPLPTPTPIPSEPISMRKGLASLNSYVLVVRTTGYSSASANQTLTSIETQYSQDLDAQFTHVTMTVPNEDEAPTQNDTYTYGIGNGQCTGNDTDGWEYDTLTPQEKETQKILSQMMDLLPIIDDPVYVGAETMNGVATNHFTFQVSGIGAESGVNVVANQGEYWIAEDGQYLVRYTLLIETIDATTQETLHTDYLIDLTNINQPVSIAFPQGCLDAQANP